MTGDPGELGKQEMVLVAQKESFPTEHTEASWETFCWLSSEVRASTLGTQVHGFGGRMCQTARSHDSLLQDFESLSLHVYPSPNNCLVNDCILTNEQGGFALHYTVTVIIHCDRNKEKVL